MSAATKGEKVPRYDWANAPKNATHASTDANGQRDWWEGKPYAAPMNSHWDRNFSSECRHIEAMEKVGPCRDWRDSLEARPAPQPEGGDAWVKRGDALQTVQDAHFAGTIGGWVVDCPLDRRVLGLRATIAHLFDSNETLRGEVERLRDAYQRVERECDRAKNEAGDIRARLEAQSVGEFVALADGSCAACNGSGLQSSVTDAIGQFKDCPACSSPAHPAAAPEACGEDAARLSLLIERGWQVQRMKDTDQWMLLDQFGYPITGDEHSTARDAIDAALSTKEASR